MALKILFLLVQTLKKTSRAIRNPFGGIVALKHKHKVKIKKKFHFFQFFFQKKSHTSGFNEVHPLRKSFEKKFFCQKSIEEITRFLLLGRTTKSKQKHKSYSVFSHIKRKVCPTPPLLTRKTGVIRYPCIMCQQSAIKVPNQGGVSIGLFIQKSIVGRIQKYPLP